MSVYFLIMISTSFGKPVAVPIEPNKYLTFSDFQEMKIAALVFLVTMIGNLIPYIVSHISGKGKELSERVKHLEKTNDIIVNKLDNIIITQAQLKDAMLSESDIIKITRQEMDHYEKISRKRN